MAKFVIFFLGMGFLVINLKIRIHIFYLTGCMIVLELFRVAILGTLFDCRCMCECISVLSVANFLIQIFNNAQYGAVHLCTE